MRKIARRSLSDRAQAMLERRANRIADAPDPRAAVRETWKSKHEPAWGDVQSALQEMSTGSKRCMYCEDSSGTDIEHFYPKLDYPDRAYDWANYLWACKGCNSNHKRDQFPLDGDRPLLIDPTSQDPSEYLDFSPSTGKWVAKRRCREGLESIRVFGLRRLDADRKRAWLKFQAHILYYARLCATGRKRRARAVYQALRTESFSGVLAALLRHAADPHKSKRLDPEVLAALERHPELHELFD